MAPQLGTHINHSVGGSLFSEENFSRLLLFFDSVHILVRRCKQVMEGKYRGEAQMCRVGNFSRVLPQTQGSLVYNCFISVNLS